MSTPIRILVVDDDEAVSTTLCAILESCGYEVDATMTLAAARDALVPEHAVIVLDRNLPDGKGEALVPYVREHAPRAKVLLLSGDDVIDVPGIDRALPKLCDPEDLIRTIAELAGR